MNVTCIATFVYAYSVVYEIVRVYDSVHICVFRYGIYTRSKKPLRIESVCVGEQVARSYDTAAHISMAVGYEYISHVQ